MHKKWCSRFLYTLLFTISSLATTATPALPVEAFSQLPKVSDIELSPDGKYIAYFMNIEESTILVTMDIEKRKIHGIIKTDNERFKFSWLEWVNPDRLIFSIYFPDHRGLGVGTTETRLFSVGPTESEPRILFKPSIASKTQYKHYSQFQDRVVSLLPADPDHILVALDTDDPTYPSVYKIDVNKGGKIKFKRPKRPVRNWIADRQGRVRSGVGYDQRSGERSIWAHNLDTDKWNMLWEYKYFSQADISPLGFGLDPHKLFINAEHNGRQSVFSIDTRQATPQMTLVAHDPNYDIEGGLIYSPKTNDVVGISHGEADNSRIYWDDRYSQFQDAIDKALPDTSNKLASFSKDERKYIIYSSSNTHPGTYYFGDRDKNSLEPIISQYPELATAQLSPRRKISYTARDGLDIEAYLTLPNNYDGKPLAAIIHPHGGPMVREYGGFDYWTQFFANRGYAVLQPNFRGSSGYGHDFMMQAVGKYGLAMQDDLSDGTQWLIEQGIADPERICIVGASYGGYAAMLAASKTPDLFKCAVSFAGVSDLLEQRNKYRNYVNTVVAFDQFGRDSKQLKQTSPINHVEKITIPLLLVHGDEDRVVDVEHSREMAEELEDHNKKFEYIELENGTHYLDKQQHRTQLFQAMDSFLAKSLNE